jgi:UDP-N-acetylmuramoyl-tripeptide--D-alanyl-D-alanine ligase
MTPMTLQQVAQWCRGDIVSGDGALSIRRLHTDSRTLREGDCFVALKGDRFDGHAFLPQLDPTVTPGAVVNRKSVLPTTGSLTLIAVDDTLGALQQAAKAYRASLKTRIVGVTGSAGKTSTKELIAHVLAQKFRTQATTGNLNNHIGVPLTLLGLETGTECAVVEMGMNHPGEIAPLADMAGPEGGVISGIGTAHIEYFENIGGIADEKGALLEALPATGFAVLNADDAWTPYLAKKTSARVILAGRAEHASWRGTGLSMTETGLSFQLAHGREKTEVKLPFFNRVMVNNALLAAAVGNEFGLGLDEIVCGLETAQIPGARMKPERTGSGWILNDVYNANAESMEAALETLGEFPSGARKGAILGSMGELGSQAVELHRRVGRAAAQQKLAYLICVGPNAEALAEGASGAGLSSVFTAEDAGAAVEKWKKMARVGDSVLVKGSRFMQLEKAVEQMRGEEIS